MFFLNMTFVGIDPNADDKQIVYAAIDHEKRLLALSKGTMDDVLAFAAGQRQAVAAVCGPRQPNQGLMKKQEVRANLSRPPAPGRWEKFRVADYCLRQHNFSIVPISESEEDCARWMRQGFEIFRRLRAMGYELYPQPEAKRWCLEVYPHAAFGVLLEQVPFPKHSLEGRLQRQLSLYVRDLDIPDPMKFFEEITRHRLLNGILPLDDLYSPAELDALVAAYTGLIAASQPSQVSLIGDPEEGQVVLPVSKLKSRY